MMPLPHEFAMGGIYMPPLLVASAFGIMAAILTAGFLNRHRLSRFFFYPPLVSMSLAVIYTILFGTFVIGT